MSVVHQPVQNGIGQGVVTDRRVPPICRQLADHQSRCAAVTVVHDFHQIVSMRGFQYFQSPVIQDQQLDFSQLVKGLLVAAVGFGLSQFQ